MDVKDAIGTIFVLALFILAGVGAADIAMDNRNFSTVVRQCEERGFIQNENIRVFCSVEKR